MFNKLFTRFILATCITLTCNTITLAADEPTALLMKPLTHLQWVDKLQSYKPKIVVVDMWAMWCVSCIERFPEMIQLHNKYKNQNIEFISMNLDDQEDKESLDAANNFLRKMNAQFDHYRMDENLIVAFEKINLISIPAVLIFNQDGIEEYRLTGDNPNKQFTNRDIEDSLITLLNQ